MKIANEKNEELEKLRWRESGKERKILFEMDIKTKLFNKKLFDNNAVVTHKI